MAMTSELIGKYDRDFNPLNFLGQGSYGSVYKVEDKISGFIYAIKKIQFKDLSDEKAVSGMRELELMSKMKSPYVVQHMSSWIENLNCIYIQMEFCCDNLQNIIHAKAQLFDGNSSLKYCSIDYFISCQLFEEVVECLNYLHSLTPPIIHRDLTPQNILVTDSSRGHFIKICDFGLSKAHEYEGQIHTEDRGNVTYMAPEVMRGGLYDIRADIYSLGIIACNLFSNHASVKNCVLRKNDRFNKLCKVLCKNIDDMKKVDWMVRPLCWQILENSKNWSLSPYDIYEAIEYSDAMNYILRRDEIFLYKFLLKKKNEKLKIFEKFLTIDSKSSRKQKITNEYLRNKHRMCSLSEIELQSRPTNQPLSHKIQHLRHSFRSRNKSKDKHGNNSKPQLVCATNILGSVDNLNAMIGDIIEINDNWSTIWALYVGYGMVLKLSDNLSHVQQIDLKEFYGNNMCRVNNLDYVANSRGLMANSVDEIIATAYYMLRNYHNFYKQGIIDSQYFVTQCRFGVGFTY